MSKIAKIIKNISNDWTVEENNQLYVCKASRKLKDSNIVPLVGDMVEFDEENNYITKVLPRKNALIRPTVANIDQVLIIVSLVKPNLDLYLLDKLLLISEYNNLTPIICFTKIDLVKDTTTIENIKKYYEKIGYTSLYNNQLDKLKTILKDKTTVLTGQSGAGKSTLVNKLDPNLDLKTNEISLSLNRGKHTTRHTQLYSVYSGYIVDTPGFSSIDTNQVNTLHIKENMIDIFKASTTCYFKDCAHIKEIKCNVKKEVEEGNILESRYNNYLKFIEEGSDTNGKTKR